MLDCDSVRNHMPEGIKVYKRKRYRGINVNTVRELSGELEREAQANVSKCVRAEGAVRGKGNIC